MHDLRPFIDRVEAIVASHVLETPGRYRRWLWQDRAGTRDLGINAYGVADAANLLYTINRFPQDAITRDGFAEAFAVLQNPDDGLFHEATHHPYHTTAHCVAALELFDRLPQRPLRGLDAYRTPDGIVALLERLEWVTSPWDNSHRGAGVYAALVLTGHTDAAWQDAYFTWLWNEFHESSGLLRRGCLPTDRADAQPIFHHLAGTFHYLFNQEYARRPLRYPEHLVDTCIWMLNDPDHAFLGRGVGFATIDWVYCLNRALRQCGHRFAEAHDALRAMAHRYVTWLDALDPAGDDGLNDLHALFGAVCALAELQAALPGELRTDRPLRLVLDRRPFI